MDIANRLWPHPIIRKAGAHFRAGHALWADHKYDEALAEIETGLAIFPRSGWGHKSAGGLYIRKGDYDAAIRHFETAVGLAKGWDDPTYRPGRPGVETLKSIQKTLAKVYASKSFLLGKEGNLPSALDHATKTYQYDRKRASRLADVYFKIAHDCFSKKNNLAAISNAANGLKCDPNRVWGHTAYT